MAARARWYPSWSTTTGTTRPVSSPSGRTVSSASLVAASAPRTALLTYCSVTVLYCRPRPRAVTTCCPPSGVAAAVWLNCFRCCRTISSLDTLDALDALETLDTLDAWPLDSEPESLVRLWVGVLVFTSSTVGCTLEAGMEAEEEEEVLEAALATVAPPAPAAPDTPAANSL